MKKTTLILTAILSAAALNAAVNTGAEIIFPLLEMGVGARALGMGGAYTAVADDPSAVHWNPAGLANIGKAEISLSYDKWFMDTSNQQILFAVPLGGGTIAGEVAYMNLGTFDGLDLSGNPTNTQVNPYNIAGSAGYGTGIMPGLSAGISIKVISQSTGSKSTMGFAGDIGALYKNENFSAGFTLQNIGSGGGYSLPMSVNLGGAFRVVNTKENRVLIATDVNYLFNDVPSMSAGAEYVFSDILAARAGYRIRFGDNNLDGLTGLSGGVGIFVAGVKLDYAIVPYGDLGITHRAALSYQFGGAGKSTTVKKDEAGIKAKVAEAEALEKEGRLKKAQEKMREAVIEDQANADNWRKLGMMYYNDKNKEAAIKSFEKYIRLKPEDLKFRDWFDRYNKK